MALEEQIVEWASGRPSWQRSVLCRVASRELLKREDYEQIIAGIVESKSDPEVSFGLRQLPAVEPGDSPVTLCEISDPEHVNALSSSKPLTFSPTGLTVVYGDNGSGKSGYARLLRRIARSRHQDEILSDVFRDTSLAKPKATLVYGIGGQEQLPIEWPSETPAELQRMLFYDTDCGEAYVVTEGDFPYRPAALFVMDGLIAACVAIRALVDEMIAENTTRRPKDLPVIEEDLQETPLGRFIHGLTESSRLEDLDRLLVSSEPLDQLQAEERRLQTSDPATEQQELNRMAEKMETLQEHLKELDESLGDAALAAIIQQEETLKRLEAATTVLAGAFRSEPHPGVGNPAWSDLWEAARRYSEANAYPDVDFPNTSDNAKCVLCHQELDEESRRRFVRFEEFIKDNTKGQLKVAMQAHRDRMEAMGNISTIPKGVESNLRDLEGENETLASELRDLLAVYEDAKSGVIASLESREAIHLFGVVPGNLTIRLALAATNARDSAAALSDQESTKARLASVTAKRKEEELRGLVRQRLASIAIEVERLSQRQALDRAKTEASTTGITKKVMELSEENITEVIRDRFTRETENLKLDHVTIAKTRAEKGVVLHKPKLVEAKQSVTLPRVFSEGERTALGLAGFFTEAFLDASKSALILDDPVSSLDHIRRGWVAVRLAKFASTRQVVVFTHDVALVADIKREALELGLSVEERSISKPRGDDARPGMCHNMHPWKAKDVRQRIQVLEVELARLRREQSTLDEEEYESKVASWAGKLSETWERVFSQEVVGRVLGNGGLEVRPKMVKVLARFTEEDDRQFQASYSRVSQWAKRHDKSVKTNYVAPEVQTLEEELRRMKEWFSRIKKYQN